MSHQPMIRKHILLRIYNNNIFMVTVLIPLHNKLAQRFRKKDLHHNQYMNLTKISGIKLLDFTKFFSKSGDC